MEQRRNGEARCCSLSKAGLASPDTWHIYCSLASTLVRHARRSLCWSLWLRSLLTLKGTTDVLNKVRAATAALQQSRTVGYSALLAFIWSLAAAVAAAWICDDAYISYRYAHNLLAGLGLVFNAGERVEGYTNFL